MIKKFFGVAAVLVGLLMVAGFLFGKAPPDRPGAYGAGAKAGRFMAPLIGGAFLITGYRMVTADDPPPRRKTGKKKKKRPRPIDEE